MERFRLGKRHFLIEVVNQSLNSIKSQLLPFLKMDNTLILQASTNGAALIAAALVVIYNENMWPMSILILMVGILLSVIGWKYQLKIAKTKEGWNVD